MTFEVKSPRRYKQKVYTFGSSKSSNFISKVLLLSLWFLNFKKIPVDFLTVCDHFVPVTAEFLDFRQEVNQISQVIVIHVKIHWKSSKYQESLPVIAQKHSYFYYRCLAVPFLWPLLPTCLIRIHLLSLILTYKLWNTKTFSSCL